MCEIEVLIIGSLHHNTLGVIRSLGEAGVNKSRMTVLLVAKEMGSKNLISMSKYVLPEKVKFVNDYSAIVPWIKSNSSLTNPVAVICCSDGAAREVISEMNSLPPNYRTPCTKINIEELMVKSSQDAIASKCGLCIPESSDFDVENPIAWTLFPCIIKPYRSATVAGKSDIHVVNSRAELDDVLETVKSERIQIQQYIGKDIEFQLIGCSLDAGKKIIIPGFTKLIRQPKNTNTGYLLYSPIKQLNYDKEAVERFIRTIGYSGLFSVEFIRGKDGKDYFLEINMRNDGNAYCVESAGVNLPYIWVYYQTYGKLPDVPTTFEKPVYFIPDFNDLKIALKTVGLPKWIKQFRQAESHSIYNKNDMGPFRFECKRVIKKLFKM